jgi:hypothetical protein
MYTYRNTITIIPASTQNPTLSYKVRVRGSCGSWSDWRTFYETNPCYEPSPVPDPDPNPAPSPEKPLPRISTNDGVLLFEIYPNPSSNYINVTLKSGTTNTSISYTLYDITSTPVKTGQLQDDNSIFVGDLKSGIYIISLTLEDYEEKQQLIIDTNGAE